MIRVAITVEAFNALAATLPLGSVAYEKERGPGESYGDVILRLASESVV